MFLSGDPGDVDGLAATQELNSSRPFEFVNCGLTPSVLENWSFGVNDCEVSLGYGYRWSDSPWLQVRTHTTTPGSRISYNPSWNTAWALRAEISERGHRHLRSGPDQQTQYVTQVLFGTATGVVSADLQVTSRLGVNAGYATAPDLRLVVLTWWDDGKIVEPFSAALGSRRPTTCRLTGRDSMLTCLDDRRASKCPAPAPLGGHRSGQIRPDIPNSYPICVSLYLIRTTSASTITLMRSTKITMTFCSLQIRDEDHLS